MCRKKQLRIRTDVFQGKTAEKLPKEVFTGLTWWKSCGSSRLLTNFPLWLSIDLTLKAPKKEQIVWKRCKGERVKFNWLATWKLSCYKTSWVQVRLGCLIVTVREIHLNFSRILNISRSIKQKLKTFLPSSFREAKFPNAKKALLTQYAILFAYSPHSTTYIEFL